MADARRGSLNTTLTPGGVKFNQLLEYEPLNPTQIIGDLAETPALYRGTNPLLISKVSPGLPVNFDDKQGSKGEISDRALTPAFNP